MRHFHSLEAYTKPYSDTSWVIANRRNFLSQTSPSPAKPQWGRIFPWQNIWWTFRPRKKIYLAPPPNSPIRRRHPPGPSAPLPPGDPPPGIFNENRKPPPPSRRLGLPFPPPRVEKNNDDDDDDWCHPRDLYLRSRWQNRQWPNRPHRPHLRER